MPEEPADAGELYGLPLEEFTAARNALAKRLRQAGRREDAAAVAKLRKPSVAAWAVNQLARQAGETVDALFAAGDALAAAQAKLLDGGADAGALRRAGEAERAAVDELTERARTLLGSGVPGAQLDAISGTFHAAALEPETRGPVREGCLERELRHVGLGAFGAPGASAPDEPDPAEERKRERERAAAAEAARKAEADARREAERARKQLGAAERRRARAAEQLAAAEGELEAARERAAGAAAALKRAGAALARAPS